MVLGVKKCNWNIMQRICVVLGAAQANYSIKIYDIEVEPCLLCNKLASPCVQCKRNI